ncbi:MAG: hypothetical protein M1821_009277 [Bathelium mastoideum]|nr:MAG: hypothetical protein M1821_009277 [Bathelium mastoideum]
MMAAQTRPPYKRGPSSAWNRLNQPPADPLEQYGFPSKGETKLNDFRAQEKYFAKIQERYMKFCGSTGGGDALEKAFDQLSLSSSGLPPQPPQSPAPPKNTSPTTPLDSPQTTRTTNTHPSSPKPPLSSSSSPTTSSPSSTAPPLNAELPLLFTAMRKLRESLVATGRAGAFARRAYCFLIRAAILAHAWEAYHPALLHLLSTIHSSPVPGSALSAPEWREFAAYRVLDAACREGDLALAVELWGRMAVGASAGVAGVGSVAGAAGGVGGGSGVAGAGGGGVRDRRIGAVVRALIRGDWHGFWRLRRAVDGYQRRVMDFAEEKVRLHAMKCLGVAYNQAERRFVERCAEEEWAELVRRGCGWECEGEWVMIKKRKAKG